MKKKRALANSRWDGSLEDSVTYSMAEEITAEIDRSVVWGILETDGWVQVSLERFQDNRHAIDIREWIEDTCQGKHLSSGSNFIFKDPRDATMFILRWS